MCEFLFFSKLKSLKFITDAAFPNRSRRPFPSIGFNFYARRWLEGIFISKEKKKKREIWNRIDNIAITFNMWLILATACWLYGWLIHSSTKKSDKLNVFAAKTKLTTVILNFLFFITLWIINLPRAINDYFVQKSDKNWYAFVCVPVTLCRMFVFHSDEQKIDSIQQSLSQQIMAVHTIQCK